MTLKFPLWGREGDHWVLCRGGKTFVLAIFLSICNSWSWRSLERAHCYCDILKHKLKHNGEVHREGRQRCGMLIKRSVYMSMLLFVHLKNDVFPISLPSFLYLSLPNTFIFFNCMQKAATSVLLSWDVRFKKKLYYYLPLRRIFLNLIHETYLNRSCLFLVLLVFQGELF